MPGPVSDSYDCEFGTGSNCELIKLHLGEVYSLVSAILDNKPPMYILDLVDANLPAKIAATFTEKELRIIRFALERAGESI